MRMFAKPRFNLLRQGWRDEAGATAVEFALIGFPFLLTLCGVFAIGMNFFMRTALNAAVNTAGRQIRMGSVSTSGMSASTFKTTYVCPALPSLFNCSNVFVNLTTFAAGTVPSPYNTYVNTAQSALIQPPLDSTKDSFCAGAASQYIVLQVFYPAPYFFSFFSPAQPAQYGGQSVAVMMATSTFKSEPYPGTAQACS